LAAIRRAPSWRLSSSKAEAISVRRRLGELFIEPRMPAWRHSARAAMLA
jgi:hypothetical protein